jgi:hypothetical protein
LRLLPLVLLWLGRRLERALFAASAKPYGREQEGNHQTTDHFNFSRQ